MGNAGWHSESYKETRNQLKVNNFANEDHFCNLIEDNIQLVSDIIFSESYVSHKREYGLPNQSRTNRMLSIDFLLTTHRNTIAIECKHPKGKNQSGIYQLMKYQLVAEKNSIPINRFVLFTTEYSHYDCDIIKRYNLPFEIYMITKEKVFSFGVA